MCVHIFCVCSYFLCVFIFFMCVYIFYVCSYFLCVFIFFMCVHIFCVCSYFLCVFILVRCEFALIAAFRFVDSVVLSGPPYKQEYSSFLI